MYRYLCRYLHVLQYIIYILILFYTNLSNLQYGVGTYAMRKLFITKKQLAAHKMEKLHK